MKENCVRKNRVGTAVALAAASLLPCVAVAVEAQALGVIDPEDATRYLSVGAQIFKGDLVKQGTGTNALSQADIHTGKGRVVVADGVLSLTGATTANQPPKPLSILSNAVVWLDASLPGTIDFVEGSSVNVSQWRDVRETGDGTTANPYLYTRAVSFTNLEHHATYAPDPDGWFPVYQPSVDGANAYVDFGQYSSGRMVLFQDPNGAKKTIQYLRHAFVVLGTQGGHYGFIFNPGSGNAVYVPKWYNLLTECTMYSFIQSSGGWATLPAGVFRVDGVSIDPTVDKPNGGYQLLDIKTGAQQGQSPGIGDGGWLVEGLFSHNKIANASNGYRQGGGRLCEILLFTKPLGESDRLKVEAYLRHKWFGAKVSTPSYVVGENGALSLASGRLDMPDPTALSVLDAATYNATTGGVERTATGGTALVKTGDGELVVGDVAADLKKIDVRSGTLRLRQGVFTSGSVPTNLCGYIEDPSFEAFTDKTIPSTGLSLTSAMHGWSSYGSYEQAVIADWKPSSGYYNLAGYPFPDGNYVGVLHIRGGLQTTVTLPADGIYRLSYWLAVRPGNSGAYTGHEHRLLVDGIPVAEVKAWDNSYSWNLCSFRLPWLAAGEHTLVLASDLNNSKEASMRTVDFGVTDSIMKYWSNNQSTTITGNIVGMVDDFHVDWIEPGEGSVSISNASFEVTTFSARGYETNPDLCGWEYVSTDSVNRVILEQTWNCRRWLHPASDGCRILNIHNLAQIGQRVTFPKAGAYTLTCAAATTTGDSTGSSGGSLLFTLGGDEIGTVTPGMFMKTYSMTFNVPTDNYTAQLVIAGQVSSAFVSLDDIRISRSGDAVVAENTFTSAGWSVDEPASDIQDGSGKVSWITRSSAIDLAAWGSTEFDDGYRVGIRNNASIWRTVAFPTAGTYRLSVASIGRFYRYNNLHLTDPGVLTRYSGNAFNVWVAKGGVTNVIGTFGVDDRERFVTHRFLFELPEGGDWEVGFSGLKQSEHKIAGNSNWHSNGGVLDGLVIEQATPKSMPTLPKAAIEITDGAKIALDYLGTNAVDTVRYAGKSYSGEINATTCPAFVTGQGTLFVQPKGTMIMFR